MPTLTVRSLLVKDIRKSPFIAVLQTAFSLHFNFTLSTFACQCNFSLKMPGPEKERICRPDRAKEGAYADELEH